MPRYICPNCNQRVKVNPEQHGKTLRCPHCHGRFMVDPGLPPGLNFEAFDQDAEPPEVQSPAIEERAPRPPVYYGPPERLSQPGWGLFWLMAIVEFAIGAMIGAANSHKAEDPFWIRGYGEFRWRFPFWENRAYVTTLWLLVVAHFPLTWCAIFHVSRRLRGHAGAATWIIVIVLLQAIGFGAFLANQKQQE